MKHVLVVDDDALMLSLIERVLADYDVKVMQDGEAALAFASQLVPIDLIITDYLMSSMMGDELIGRLRQLRPGVKVLIITGHGGILEREVPDWWRAESHLSKPFGAGELREAVQRLIGPPDVRAAI
jgi:CheY-like chemotaxis protein